MSREKIEKLEELLQHEIGNDKKIVATKTTRLTSPGENYGGLLLRVDLTLKDAKGKQDNLHVVAKSIPINIFMQKLFDIQVSVRKEIAVYDTILPVFQQFQRERGVSDVIDFLPKFYGARLNINNSDVVDEHSVIVLENLEHSGYKNVDRLVGFDLDTSKLILEKLATLHSTVLALRLSKPDVFEEKVKPHLTLPRKEGPPPDMADHGEDLPTPPRLLKEFIQSCEELHPFLPKLIDLIQFNPANQLPQLEGLFSTISHGDLWVNNIMVKFENDKPVALKFLDFQNITLRSVVADLIFFLITSTQQSILKTKFDELIEFYHKSLVKSLDQLKCDSTPYSLEKLLEEIKTDFKSVLGQALFMTIFIVLNNKSKSVVIPEDDLNKPPELGKVEDILPEAKERVIFIIKHCNEKGWL